MKKIAIFVMLIALLSLGASALQVGSPTLGSENSDRIKNVVTTFTVTNNNTVAMTGVTFSLGGGAENTKYALAVSGPSSIGASSTVSYTLNGTIPLDHSGIDSADLQEKALKIGTLTITGDVSGVADSATADINMQAVNQLKIKKARVECDTKSQSVDDNDRVKNLKPGMDCTLEVQVENNFDDSDHGNQKIGDIGFDTVDINIDSSDSDVDVDEGDNIDGLNGGDDDSATSDIQIDDEASDGTVSIEIRMFGRDDNGALHGEKRTFRLEVNRLTHDIQVRHAELSPAAVSNCDATHTKLTVNVLNQGKRNEKNVVIEATATDLQFSKKVEDIELDKDDSTAAMFDIQIPKDAKEGVVRVDVKTYFDGVAPSNSGSVELNVNKCSTNSDEPVQKPVMDDKKQTTAVVPQTAPVVPQGQAQAAPRKQSSFTDSKAYVALLVVLSILIAAAIVALVVVMARKKRVD